MSKPLDRRELTALLREHLQHTRQAATTTDFWELGAELRRTCRLELWDGQIIELKRGHWLLLTPASEVVA